jgi:hypothetical protein
LLSPAEMPRGAEVAQCGGLYHWRQGQGRDVLSQARVESPTSLPTGGSFTQRPLVSSMAVGVPLAVGQAYGRVGRTDKAREVLRRLAELSTQRYVTPYHFAYVYTGLGEQERSMDWLERAHEQRAGAVFGIKGSFLFTSLRGHPRFQALLRKMNLA